MDLEQAARECLTRPGAFAYFGDLPLFVSYGFTFAVHRDSDVLERSNWETISQDLLERFPEDCEIVPTSHCLVGWMDHLAVRILLDADAGITAENIAPAFRAVCEWIDALENYPVANEDHFCALEYEDALETLENCYSLNAADAERVYSYLLDGGIFGGSGEDLREQYVNEAMDALGLLEDSDA